ncbi:MAG: arylesterase [Hyphomicrobium sp.]
MNIADEIANDIPGERRTAEVACTLLALLWAALICLSVMSTRSSAAEPSSITLVAFGDSLSAGFMLPPSAAFPAQLQVALRAKGYKVDVVNAGVSGDTSGGGLQRLDWTLQTGADGVILELGANDALRGVEPRLTKDNLDKILNFLKLKGVDVLLTGMKAPGNWGPEYQATFDVLYPELAGKYAVPLYPFFLEGVLGESELIMDDGLHPTEKGVAEIVKRILPDAEALLKRITQRKAAAGKS